MPIRYSAMCGADHKRLSPVEVSLCPRVVDLELSPGASELRAFR